MKIPWTANYIPHKPFATQLEFLLIPHLDALFGGAAGGGKSDVLLMAALQFADTPGYSALLLRRTLVELKQNEALLDRAAQWLRGCPTAHYSPDEHTYYFDATWPDGSPGPYAKLQFGYLGDYRVEERYQGAEFSFVGIDEAGHFENDQAPRYLFSRIRKKVCPKHKLKKDPTTGEMTPNYMPGCMYCDVYKSIPLRFRMSCNPGGPGHMWIKNRYQIEKELYDYIDPKTKEVTKRVRWVGKNPNKPFIPSSLRDNEYIDQKSYRGALQELDEVRKLQLEHGDWDASPDSRFRVQDARFYKSKGDYFVINGRGIFYKDLKRVFMTADSAATVTEGMIDQDTSRKAPSHTVYSVWGLTYDYQLLWLHMHRMRAEIPECVRHLVEIYKAWKPAYVKMETNGLGIGPAQLASMYGLNVVGNPKSKDKIQNSTNAQLRMRNNRIWFPESAPWLKACMDEVFTWTGHPGMSDDIVDTLSDACNDVTWEGQGLDPMFAQNSVHESSLEKYRPMTVNLDLRSPKSFNWNDGNIFF
jgi:phage terminase large subunit-like protein